MYIEALIDILRDGTEFFMDIVEVQNFVIPAVFCHSYISVCANMSFVLDYMWVCRANTRLMDGQLQFLQIKNPDE